MYRNYKSYRHFLNAKLHALSVVISGDDTVLDAELGFMGKESVKDLTDAEAKKLYKEFIEVAKKTSLNLDKVKAIVGQNRSSQAQRNAIIKISRYILGWKDESIVGYILETIPELRKKMLEYEIKKHKVYRLLNALNVKQADKVIKRLDQIQRRNNGKG